MDPADRGPPGSSRDLTRSHSLRLSGPSCRSARSWRSSSWPSGSSRLSCRSPSRPISCSSSSLSLSGRSACAPLVVGLRALARALSRVGGLAASPRRACQRGTGGLRARVGGGRNRSGGGVGSGAGVTSVFCTGAGVGAGRVASAPARSCRPSSPRALAEKHRAGAREHEVCDQNHGDQTERPLRRRHGHRLDASNERARRRRRALLRGGCSRAARGIRAAALEAASACGPIAASTRLAGAAESTTDRATRNSSAGSSSGPARVRRRNRGRALIIGGIEPVGSAAGWTPDRTKLALAAPSARLCGGG